MLSAARRRAYLLFRSDGMKRRKASVVLLSLALSLLCTGCKDQEEGSSQPDAVADSKSKETEYISYKTVADNYEAKLPSDWIRTLNGNKLTVTEAHSGTYISIEREDYFPEINSYSSEYLAYSLKSEGTTLQSFTKENGKELKLILSYTVNNSPIIEYKYVIWNYESVYYICYVTSPKYESQFMPIYKTVYESFKTLKEEKQITNGYQCIYNEDLGLSLEYPLNWSFSSEGNGFSVDNPNTKSSILFEIADPIPEFKNYTKLDYNDIIQSFAKGASLVSFENTGATMAGTAYATAEGQKYIIENVLIDNGSYTAVITYLASSAYAQSDESVYRTMLDSIRYYRTPQQDEPQSDSESDQEAPDSTETSDTDNTSDNHDTENTE